MKSSNCFKDQLKVSLSRAVFDIRLNKHSFFRGIYLYFLKGKIPFYFITTNYECTCFLVEKIFLSLHLITQSSFCCPIIIWMSQLHQICLVYSSSCVKGALFSKQLVFLISLETKDFDHVFSQPSYHPQFKHKIAVQNVSESFIFTTHMFNGT